MIFTTLEALYQKQPEGPFLGLDWGKVYMGAAISDKNLCFAMPLKVFKAYEAVRTLHMLFKEYQATALIIGWPLHGNGAESSVCEKIKKFARILPAEWNIAFFDERFSTKESSKTMLAIDHKQKREDEHAAAIILQGALDTLQRLH